MLGLLAVVIAYLLGSIPFGYLLVKFTSGAALSGGTGSGTSAAVLGVLAAGAVGVGVAVAAKGSKTDSNG